MTLDYTQQHLVKMANQIAGNVPSPDDVAGQIADHVTRFWTPVMRSDLGRIGREEPGVLASEVHAALAVLEADGTRQ